MFINVRKQALLGLCLMAASSLTLTARAANYTPVSGTATSFDKYLMNFLAIPWEKNQVYYDRYTDEEYLRWLKMFRELGEEGYLAGDIFVDTRTQMEEKIAQGRYFCMIYQYTDMLSQQK